MARRRSPTFFKRKGSAIAFFVLAVSMLVVGTYLGLGMLTRYDFEFMLPEDAELRSRFPKDDDYHLPEVTPTPMPEVTPTPLPTPMPAPAGTPVPLVLYSVQDTRMVMPANADAPGDAGVTSMTVSQADESRTIIVNGWAYLDGVDAQLSNIYLVTSPRSSTGHRFYAAQVLPGASGIVHKSSGASNLERADFRAVFSVRAYADGPYKLGVLVVNRADRQIKQGYFEFDQSYNFDVRNNAVIGIG